ncbi:MAG: insulinase family protein [Treponema sp.]|nr:insulinase family protein [Treponema sp.]
MISLKKIITSAAVLLFCAEAFAKQTPIQGLNEYRLENGLTLFTLEDHNVPLAYIEIAFKTGAVDSTPENAGLFYLYEHLMFRGNALYTTPNAMQEALYDIGVTDWKGTTNVDYMNFAFTVPNNELERGLAFWNAAIRTPNVQDLELTVLRENVARRIEQMQKDQGVQYNSYSALKLFPDAPYRTDATGSANVIRKATVAQINDLMCKYYIPKNAAIFVGGDIDREQVYELTKKIFGDWSNKNLKGIPSKTNDRQKQQNFNFAASEEYSIPKNSQQNTNPFDATKYAVIPYQASNEKFAQVSIKFRGPDTDFDLEDTYVADYLCSLMLDPEGVFKKSFCTNEKLGIPSSDYLEASYVTKREDGVIEVKAFLKNPNENITERAQEAVLQTKKVFWDIANNPSLFEKDVVKEKAAALEDMDLIAGETVQGKLATLRFWWACASSDYYYSYKDKLAQVSQEDALAFVKKYIDGKNPLVTVVLSPSYYENQKDEFEGKGFELITEKNAFWQNESRYAAKEIDKDELLRPLPCDVYYPRGRGNSESKAISSSGKEVKKYTLKNGVPLYVQNNASSDIDSICIGVRGGLPELTPETSGLADATLNLAARSSRNFNSEQRKFYAYKYTSSMDVQTETLGNALSLTVLDKYWKDALPLLTDSFLNPDFSEEEFNSFYEELSLAANKKTTSNLLAMLEYAFAYSGHPFESMTGVTLESLSSITLANIKKTHEQMLNPSALFVVASGKIDGEELLSALNESIGLLEQKGPVYSAKEIPAVKLKASSPISIKCRKGESVRIASRLFEYPLTTDEDFIAARIASAVYSDVMLKVARDHRAACKAAQENVISSKASIAEDCFTGVLNLEYLKDAWDEACALMSLGMVVQSNHGEKGYLFTDLAKILPRYKNMFIAKNYQTQNTSAASAAMIVYNLLEFNDENMESKKVAAIQQLTAEDVLRTFNKYWVNTPHRWFTAEPKEND